MNTKYFRRIALAAFATVLCVAANTAFAQSQAGDNGKRTNDPASVQQREQRMAASVTSTPRAAANETAATAIDTEAPGFDAAVMAAKPPHATGKAADDYAAMKVWVSDFTRRYNGLSDPGLYLTKQQITWFEQGDWESLYRNESVK